MVNQRQVCVDLEAHGAQELLALQRQELARAREARVADDETYIELTRRPLDVFDEIRGGEVGLDHAVVDRKIAGELGSYALELCLAAGDENALDVGLEAGDPVNDVDPRLLQALRRGDSWNRPISPKNWPLFR